MAAWNLDNASELYRINDWSLGYFNINEAGNVSVKPSPDSPHSIDLKKLMDELIERKINPPLLIRFTDILKHRIARLSSCFHKAIEENQYRGDYKPLFPIKVNQEKDVITSVLRYGKEWGLGLEAGSKAELMIVLAQAEELETPIVCNGYKDKEFVELVCMAHKMGKKIFPVIENFGELHTFINHYKETGVIPRLGIRVKLSTKGTGQWAKTGGDNSKFGLRIPEVMAALKLLNQENLLDSLKLLHFHVGSQISRMSVVKQSILETTRVYVESIKLGAKLEYIDIGGGLGVDYSGNAEGRGSSINYSVDEYANDVVYRIKQLCDEHEIPHPNLFSESGRFLSAHYSLMITNVAAINALPESSNFQKPERGFGPLYEMYEILDSLNPQNMVECYHDATQYKNEALSLFNLGHLTLPERSDMEEVYWEILRRIHRICQTLENVPSDLEDLSGRLSDTYFTNFSIFQSLPDAWAINQVFPIMPIHRLSEEPSKQGVVADLTCDSDGLVESYVTNTEGGSRALPMHELKPGEPYYLGIFLTGAYQETLGELHNLFGDPHAVLVEVTGDNQYRISGLVKGDTIQDVISYMTYDTNKLRAKMHRQIEAAVHRGDLTIGESGGMMDLFDEGLRGYTYFEDY